MKTDWCLIAIIALSGCTPPPADDASLPVSPPAVVLPESYRFLEPAEADAWIKSTPGILLLDVRREEEFLKEGRLPNSIHIDLLWGEEFDKKAAQLDRTKPVLVYCAVGGRAELAAGKLARLGFQNVAMLKGGLNAWITAGLPLFRG